MTKASTIGPIAEAVEAAGGSVTRVFEQAELPIRLLERPEQLLPLRDQCGLVEHACREIGDEALPARLSIEAGLGGLGQYGRRMASQPLLGRALSEAYASCAPLLQGATRVELFVDGRWARWTYRVTEPFASGRQENELLAIGYMLNVLRHFLGEHWAPCHADVPGPALHRRGSIESAFGCEVASGEIAAVVFPRELLDVPNSRPADFADGNGHDVPALDDFLSCVRELVALALLEGRPQVDGVAHRFGLSRRTFQRHLADRGMTFDAMMRGVLMQQASDFLTREDVTVTEIAYELGYSDPAHFTRAFQRWIGQTPRAWRAGVRATRTFAATRGSR
ncbi:MAG TPA: AraC family transcriptional regulator [Candidatus Limnocylindria bacterium]|nr:AraC family transcriptional regulator [Candidatus Limnocylindria bacterium]